MLPECKPGGHQLNAARSSQGEWMRGANRRHWAPTVRGTTGAQLDTIYGYCNIRLLQLHPLIL